MIFRYRPSFLLLVSLSDVVINASKTDSDDLRLDALPQILEVASGKVDSSSSLEAGLRSHARLRQVDVSSGGSDEGGAKCATNGGTDARCKPVDVTDGRLSVCFSVTNDEKNGNGDGGCAMWIQKGLAGSDVEDEGPRDLCCRKCSVCEGGKAFTYDCSNIVEDFEANCTSSLTLPNDFTLIDSNQTGVDPGTKLNKTNEMVTNGGANEAETVDTPNSKANETKTEATEPGKNESETVDMPESKTDEKETEATKSEENEENPQEPKDVTQESGGTEEKADEKETEATESEENEENPQESKDGTQESGDTEEKVEEDSHTVESNLEKEDYIGPFQNAGIIMTFHGMSNFKHHAQRVFTSEYKKYVESFYEDRGAEAIITVEITGIDNSPLDRRRRLGQEPAVAVRFDQESKYRGLPPGTTPETFLTDPFAECDAGFVIDDAECGGTEVFLEQLTSAHKTFESLTAIDGPDIGGSTVRGSTVQPAAAAGTKGEVASPSSSGGNSTTVVIVVVIIVTVIIEILLMGAAFYLWKKRKEKKKALEGKEVKTMDTEKEEEYNSSDKEEKGRPKDDCFEDDNASLGPSIVDNYVMDGDDGTLSYYDPGQHRASQAPSVVSDADDQTAEYDYRRAFLSGPYNGQSVVSGATREEQSTWSDANTKEENLTVFSGRDESTQYTDDEHTRAVLPYLLPYKGMQRGKSWRNAAEYYKNGRRMTIDAPPGKLGLVIDNPDGWAPVVHTVNPASVLRDMLRVGDRLLAVDGDDVTGMTAVEVSKMIAKRCNRIRRLKLVRAPDENEEV